jgi:hypothetical protein
VIAGALILQNEMCDKNISALNVQDGTFNCDYTEPFATNAASLL